MSLQITDGYVKSNASLPHKTIPHQVYYKTIKSMPSSASDPKSSDACPLFVASGGPFLSHDYCLTLQQLAHHPKVTMLVFYDHLGCGKSSRIDVDFQANFSENFWEINLLQLRVLVEELAPSADTDGIYLLGHSMGSVLAASYAATYPHEVRALILASAITSFADSREANLQLLKRYPAEVADAIIEYEKFCLGESSDQSITTEQYLAASNLVRNEHFTRAENKTEWFSESLKNCFEVMDVFAMVCGGTVAFMWGGPMVEYSTEPLLTKISAPTLIIKGEYDQALPFCQEPFLRLISNVQEVTLSNSSHMLTEEVPGKLNSTVEEFLTRL